MNINLSKEFTEYINSCVDTGFYANSTDVIRDALRHMKERQEHRKQALFFNQTTLDAIDEIDNGGGKRFANTKDFKEDLLT